MYPTLYSFRRCPYAIRARYTLALLNFPVVLREIVLKNKPQALLDLGGRSSVPQLITCEGRRYPESLDIIFYALQASESELVQRIWPKNQPDQVKILTWIRYNDGKFKHWLDRYKYADRYPEFNQEYYRTKAEIFLQRLNQRLSHSAFLCGENMSLADIGVFPFIRQLSMVDIKWFEASPYEHLNRWLKGFTEQALFTDVVMEKFIPWLEDSAPIVFPREKNSLCNG
ncbi:glutathione S-transferase [Marinomonas epiphytica]